ncbi:ABC transporter ATP-binding protein [Paenibacillus sp. NPDC058177]|uniref:ABC transporter ATP-binding protein n=1 Tax=Paenibacillus sp. NPDC058177 TaxID=3346369 RepID=UPI0036DA42DE
MGNNSQQSVWSQLHMLWPIIRRYRLPLINLFLCVLVTSVVGMVYPYIFGLLVDEVFYHRNMSFFLFIVAGYGLIYVCEQGLHLVLNSVWTYLVTRFTFDIRKKLYDKLITLKSTFFHNSRTGDLMTILNRDAEEVMELIHWNIFYLTANALRLLTAIAFVLYANVYLGLLMIIVIPAVVFTTLAFNRATKSRMERQRKQYGKLMSWCVEMLGGLRDIRLMGADRYTTRQFVHQLADYMRLKNQTSSIGFFSERAVSLVALVSDLILYITASILIVKGQLTVGGFVAMIEYFARASGLLKNMSGAGARLQQNKVALERVVGLLANQEEDRSVNSPNLLITKGSIEFSKVSFGYRKETPVLRDLNLSIQGGQAVAIVGKSGSGKSTLISLLLRLYDPEEGEIVIDGMPIQHCRLASIRSSIVVALQEPYLFEGTIRDNLLWGNAKQSDQMLWHACEQAAIHDYILELPDGLDTKIGGRLGISMSGGQKQRIALARTFMKKPRMVIFDEATSALDGETEQVVRDSWRKLGPQTTILIIAHRLSTIREADQVAVLDEGRIVAYGHHEELLQRSSTYRKLFAEQYTEYGEVING